MEILLDELCGYLNNYFVVKPKGVHHGTFEITPEDGLVCDFLQEGQYFAVRNSVFNNGVFKYPAEGMTPEVFTGEVWAMAVPPAVIALLSDIETWQAKYGSLDSVNYSPFTSESFNNYSYSKGSKSGEGSSTSGTPLTWKDVFKDRFIRWKKVSL